MSASSPLNVSMSAVEQAPPALQLQNHLRHMHVLRPGLHVHADDMVDTQDFTAVGEIEQGLRIVMLLEGSVDVSYGHRRVVLNSAAGERSRPGRCGPVPRGLLVSIAESDRFERRARQGCRARRLSIGMGEPWLTQVMAGAALPPVDDFVHAHLAMQAWQPSARAIAMAEQLVHTPALSGPFLNLYMESRVLELVSEALACLGSPAASAPAPAPASAGTRLLPHEYRRIRALHAFLQTDQAFDLSLDELAHQAGTNANTLQKHFRAVYGTTVFDHLRECRLQRARQALERDGLSVSQAALLAGYSSAANFATAFRKRFGLAPKLARGRF